ncbi:conserved protein of unknown function [Georgfuchsia toluolica]|uniref:Uncharacterized protein n=1 Tax=Georgfuchsia toluolica TaxID=424218 RepID=A0A916J777_9PROT|nr:hypothetical protein [Georgfuchsia toluolica]CAG4885290.1 conserved protein of unknown function [Georgfuchsia toluolica]
MIRNVAVVLLVAFCVGCATNKPAKPERNAGATSMRVDGASVGRKVLAEVPAESAMERFEMLDRKGREIDYVAFTDTDYGGLLFLDNKIYGTLSKRDVRAFYSCRGYATATHYHWARDALDWFDSLLAAATPAESATLDFSGKSTMQSVKEVVSNPVLSDVRSLVGMGTNPFSIFSKLSSAHSNMVERENYEKTQQALRALEPGDSEEKVAQIVRPEDVSFTTDGMVMAYPKYSLDFYVNGGVVKVLQQPSFDRLSRLHAAIFYVPNLRWDQCTPHNWRQALPVDWQPPPNEEGTATTGEGKNQ